MSYFVMVCEGKHPIMPIAKAPRVSGRWCSGRPLTVPVTAPLVYTLDKDLNPLGRQYLGDPEKVKAAMDAVAKQGSKK